MIRSSSVYQILTKKPKFDLAAYNEVFSNIKSKVVEKTKMPFDMTKLDVYEATLGLKTVTKDFRLELKKRHLFTHDPLPEGAKTYLEKLWLQNNTGFYDPSPIGERFAIRKGKLSEDAAISIIGEVEKVIIYKYKGSRKTSLFLTGLCDVLSPSIIREVKVPENWLSFRSKTELSFQYFCQIVAYCYLFERPEGILYHALMPTPITLYPYILSRLDQEEIENFHKTEEAIKKLPLKKRVKRFPVSRVEIATGIDFLIKREKKSKEYYETLTYEKCMKF